MDTKSGDRSVKPIIRIEDTSNVTIENVVLAGANGGGGFHRHLVGQAGLDLRSSSNVSILNVSVVNTFGDGLTAFANFPIDKSPTSDLVVNGLNITNAGRQAITMAFVTDSILNNVTVNSASGSGWDFESDLPGIGSGNIIVSNSRSTKGVRFVEALRGPIMFDNCQCQRHVALMNDAAASRQVVIFNGGTLLLPNTDHGISKAGITVRGPGRLVFDGVVIGRLPASRSPSGPAWSVTGGGFLALVRSPVAVPLGYSDRGSTVVTIK
ncbi:MAG: hypothetical protein ACRDYE_09400 [Acidimicrobiales bacterium]